MESQARTTDIKRAQKVSLESTTTKGVSILRDSNPTVLAKKAKLANIEAEHAISLAYQAEMARTRLIAEAMYKSGFALRCSYESAIKQIKDSIDSIIHEMNNQFNKN